MRRLTLSLLMLLTIAGPAAADDALLLDGFGFEWEKHPHRINKIGAVLEAEKARLTLEGGTWATGEAGTDSATSKLFYSRLSASGLRTHTGTSPTLHMRGKIRIGAIEPAIGKKTIWLNLTKLGLAGHKRFSVLLRGFSIDTDASHEVGFTTKGIGAKILDVGVYKGTHSGTRWLKFTVWLRIEAGKVPERWQKLRSYAATGSVAYTVVALKRGRITRKRHGYTLRYPAGIEPKRPHASAAEQSVLIKGKPGLPSGAVGLTGFDMRLNPGKTFYSGRYMMAVRLRNSHFDYTPETGHMRFRCDGYFSNKGPVAWALTHTFEARFVLLQTGAATLSQHKVGGEQSALHTTFPLD